MISTKKIALLRVWKENPFDEFSISEIMKMSNKKTKPWVFNTLKYFVNNNLFISKRKSNLDFYRLNLDNPNLIQMLIFLDSQDNLNFPRQQLIIETIKTIPVKNYCLLVFGSYAENKQIKTSDLDLCFLIEDNNIEKKISSYFDKVRRRSLSKIDEHYITFKDFIKMLVDEEENLGKQIFKKHRIIFNGDIYYELIKEAYKNGFRP